jgi:hypothetical protein
MKPLDLAKSVGTALAVMIVNVAISFVVVAVYSVAVEPGHDDAFYQAAAGRIAPWSSVAFGAPLFFLAAFVLGRKSPTRNPYAFAVASFAVYAIIDVSLLVASADILSFIGIVALSLSTKLAGALLGAHLSRRRR